MSRAGDVYENIVTGERAVIRVGTEDTPEGNLLVDLYVRPGGAVMGEHLHPSIDERLTVLAGAVGITVDGSCTTAGPGDAVELPAGSVHDWWNAGEQQAHVRVEISPGARFEEMIVTFWGLANAGRTNAKGMPGVLQLAVSGREFSDVVRFTRPPLALQRLLFALLAPLARRRGLRGSYPELRPRIESAREQVLAA